VVLRRLVVHPAVQIAAGLWIAAYCIVLLLADGRLPIGRRSPEFRSPSNWRLRRSE
jgi:hypothetical protein